MSPGAISVMLVDDHAVVRMGFRLLLEGTDDLRVVAEAQSGEEAVRLCAEARPDVVVMDLSMPGIGGLEAINRILSKLPDAKILVLSAHEDTAHPRRALAAGAKGYLTKRSAAEELINAIRTVARGKNYIEPSMAQVLAVGQVTGKKSPIDILSGREFEVFMLLAKGKSVADIADALSLSPRTVGTHMYHVKQKLNAGNAAELAIIAMQHGLLEP
jgi:two-component system invasion response regulator UvrY